MQDYLDYGTLNIFYEEWNAEDNWFTPVKTKKCDISMFEPPHAAHTDH